MLKSKNKQFIIAVISTFFFCLFAHGYRFMNLMNAHDSMAMIIQDDVYWQRSLGRFMQPLIMVLRGSVCAPWLLGIYTSILLSISVWLITKIFDINHTLLIVLLSGVMTCNLTLTTSCAIYHPWTDIYTTALLFNLIGVWLCLRRKIQYTLMGAVFFALGMGFYQAYITVAISLLLILTAKELLEKDKFKEVIKVAAGYVGGLLIGAVLYYLLYKGICLLHHVEPANTYNGLVQLTEFNTFSPLKLIQGTYADFIHHLNFSPAFVSIILLNTRISNVWRIVIAVINWYCVAVIVGGIIRLCILRKKKWWNILLLCVSIILFPIASDFLYLLARGQVQDLMDYGLLSLYFFALMILVMNFDSATFVPNDKKQLVPILCILPVFLIIWNNIVFSNQIYYKLHLQQEALQSNMTKIIYDVEHLEGYEYGSTPVIIHGSFSENPYFMVPEYFNEISVLGMGNSPVSFVGTLNSYVKYVLNINMQFDQPVSGGEPFDSMPTYPARGSIIFLDDKVYIKLAD